MRLQIEDLKGLSGAEALKKFTSALSGRNSEALKFIIAHTDKLEGGIKELDDAAQLALFRKALNSQNSKAIQFIIAHTDNLEGAIKELDKVAQLELFTSALSGRNSEALKFIIQNATSDLLSGAIYNGLTSSEKTMRKQAERAMGLILSKSSNHSGEMSIAIGLTVLQKIKASHPFSGVEIDLSFLLLRLQCFCHIRSSEKLDAISRCLGHCIQSGKIKIESPTAIIDAFSTKVSASLLHEMKKRIECFKPIFDALLDQISPDPNHKERTKSAKKVKNLLSLQSQRGRPARTAAGSKNTAGADGTSSRGRGAYKRSSQGTNSESDKASDRPSITRKRIKESPASPLASGIERDPLIRQAGDATLPAPAAQFFSQPGGEAATREKRGPEKPTAQGDSARKATKRANGDTPVSGGVSWTTCPIARGETKTLSGDEDSDSLDLDLYRDSDTDDEPMTIWSSRGMR